MLSSLVGCQSMGAMRSSNLDEWPSFHLRKTVQRMAIPPTEAATAMSMVVTVLLGFVAAAPLGAVVPVSAAPTSTELVCVTVDFA